jgi:hypothetical protein
MFVVSGVLVAAPYRATTNKVQGAGGGCQAPAIAGCGEYQWICAANPVAPMARNVSRITRAHTLKGPRTRARALCECGGIRGSQPPAAPYAAARVAATATARPPRHPHPPLRRETSAPPPPRPEPPRRAPRRAHRGARSVGNGTRRAPRIMRARYAPASCARAWAPIGPRPPSCSSGRYLGR